MLADVPISQAVHAKRPWAVCPWPLDRFSVVSLCSYESVTAQADLPGSIFQRHHQLFRLLIAIMGIIHL